MDDLKDYVQSVITDLETTWHQYEPLRSRVKTQPIPFFGDIKKAHVLTVGVNPSAKEFVVKRDWPETMTAEKLKCRLQRYFEHDPTLPEPHKWFETWSQALAPLGVTYQDGAAHIDLSPRATVSMSGAVQSGYGGLFVGMVEQDAKWFFKLLGGCTEARLLLFAGCVPGDYISEFMERSAPKYGFKFLGSRTQTGQGMTGFYNLRGSNIDLPAFFCSLSPSARKLEQRQLLVRRVEENREVLCKHIGRAQSSLLTNNE